MVQENIELNTQQLGEFRVDYNLGELVEEHVDPNPFIQFRRWFDGTTGVQTIEPNAMAIATATSDGRPSVRMVLMKGFDENGVVFYTNYEGRKGREVDNNPRAAAVFYWDILQRQVRIEGGVTRLSEDESDVYFQDRPRDAQIGAWASRQSEIIPDRSFLEQRVREVQEQFDGRQILRPPFWGGYRITPDSFEFWQGRKNRLHDRLLYSLQEDKTWSIQRLSP